MTLASFVVLAAEAEAEGHSPLASLVPPAIAVVFFVVLGFITWSYRAVANRQGPGTGSLESNH